MKVVIYSKENCAQCETVKKMLSTAGIAYKEKNVMDIPKFMDELYEVFPTIRSLPGVVFNGQKLDTGSAAVDAVRSKINEIAIQSGSLSL